MKTKPIRPKDAILAHLTKSVPSVVIDTFNDLIEKKHYTKGMIVHSDQGFQYTHKFLGNKLSNLQIKQSMSRKGTPLDNAVIECFFGIFKSEVLYNSMYDISSEGDIVDVIEKWIVYYNNERIKRA